MEEVQKYFFQTTLHHHFQARNAKISPIFHFDRGHNGWICHILSVKQRTACIDCIKKLIISTQVYKKETLLQKSFHPIVHYHHLDVLNSKLKFLPQKKDMVLEQWYQLTHIHTCRPFHGPTQMLSKKIMFFSQFLFEEP